ncbi:hypothetical protein F5Y16DRAFT_393745 [Xylariaceae sp. FL0255]|nr:hypothetical protein F5Y16DRAFT_393745 [Xylariaceae sp. FL0255]
MDAANRDDEDRYADPRHHHHLYNPNPHAYEHELLQHHEPRHELLQHPQQPYSNHSAFESHAAANRGATHVNANAIVGFDPQDFYHPHPDDPLMASALPLPRPTPGASLRSNANPSGSRHPAIPSSSSTRSSLKPGFRSVSAPFEDRLSPSTSRPRAVPQQPWNGRNGHQPSVKDLKKRFDHHAAQTNATVPRKTPPRIPVRDPSAHSQPRPATTRSPPRNKVSVEGQSFASRIAKPRPAVGAQSQASRSMTNLLPAPSSTTTNAPPVPQSRGLLFGEIVPGQVDTGLAGHGIHDLGTRRTSESNLPAPVTRRQRSFSHTDIEPSSPSDWYRALRSDSSDSGDGGPSRLHPTTNHGRSRSDGGSALTSQQLSITTKPLQSKPALDPTPASPASRIPVSTRKLGTPSSSSSPDSTRSNSPTTVRRPQAQGRVFTNLAASPKTYMNNVSVNGKRVNRPEALSTNGNTRLNVYVSTAPPKLSPPLRSSRPRQPVSAATTASSRMKAVERDKPTARKETQPNVRGNEQPPRRRKISMGPIDFESRREQIKLSYSKSLRENEARAAARRAALERKQKTEAEVLAAQEAAAEVRETEEVEISADIEEAPLGAEDSLEKAPIMTMTAADPVTNVSLDAKPSAELPPLNTDRDLNEVQTSTDSPTLGIPGSFPITITPDEVDEEPLSAVSATTEFDAEPQTEPATQEPHSLQEPDRISHDLDDEPHSDTVKTQYRSPFDEDSPTSDDIPINVPLDALIEPAARIEDSLDRPESLNAYESTQNQDHEYEPMPFQSHSYETKVTIIRRDTDFTSPAATPESFGVLGNTSVREGSEGGNIHSQAPTIFSGSSPNDPVNGFHELAEQPSTTGLSEIEEFFVGPMLKENQPIRDGQPSSTQGAKSAGHVEDDNRFSLDSKKTLGTRPSLTVPRTIETVNRISQTTVWTDYSINSHDSSSGYEFTDHDSQQPGSSWQDNGTQSEMDSQPDSRNYGLHHQSSSREVSPRGTYPETGLYNSRHRLPEIDTGEGFTVEIPGRKNSMLPDLSPVPPPDDVSLREALSSAPPSEYYDETRPTSYIRNEKDDQSLMSTDVSRRESDYFPPSESASRSIDQVSLGTADGPLSGSSRLTSQQTLIGSINIEQSSELSTKERKRLFTRLETVKELIDTEAFFIRDMNIVEEIYKGTAEACPELDDKTIKLIFRNTDQIIKFHSSFLGELKEGVSGIYTPRTHRNMPKETSDASDRAPSLSGVSTASTGQLSDERDRETSLGPTFLRNMEKMKAIHETFLKNSDHAAKRLIQIQEDQTVQVWLNECNEVARELTRAWNLDSLLIKPMQRITKYPNLLIQLLHETPSDHPDRPSLEAAKVALENAIEEINKTKKNFELVGQIVGRKRKESDVKAGFARAFGKRVDKLQTASSREPEDAEYIKLHEKFGDDYLRLQVVLRDVEFYTRQVTDYVHEFLKYLSSMELVMRLQPSPHPEIESKWVRFNVSMRDIEKIALEQHLSQVRKQVIEPFELVIKSYSNPSLAMKKRSKRRVDYEKFILLQKGGKKIDKQLCEFVEQYEALNEALKKELPKLSSLTEKVGNICLGNFVNIQAQWYSIWKEKVKVVLENPNVPEISDIVSAFYGDYNFLDDQMSTIGIINPASRGRPSHSNSVDEASGRLRLRPAELSPRHRGLSLNSELAPSLPTPDFMNRHSGQFAISPTALTMSNPNQFYRDYYNGASASPRAPDLSSARSLTAPSLRPSTGQSHDSGGVSRPSVDSGSQSRPYSNSVQPSSHQTSDNHRYSGLFQSALPLSDLYERPPRPSQVSSRASSRERQPVNGYNVLWLAASLFEFNIETTKHEAGYPYLTYHAGEIFDVIAEKGELWLAKNQDDPNNLVGWLWSKHFAKLADD